MVIFVGTHKFEAIKIGEQLLTATLDGYRAQIAGMDGYSVIATKTAMTFAVDYNLSTATSFSGITFYKQSQIDAYLSSRGTTAFKHLQDVLDSLPQIIQHEVTINMAAGVHRPRLTDPTTFSAAFRVNPHFHMGAAISIIGASSSSFGLVDPALTGLVVTSFTSAPTPSITFAGTPFAGKNVRATFARISTGQLAMICDHNNNTLFLTTNPSPNPTGATVDIVRPATFLRNSLNDVSPRCSYLTFVDANGTYSPTTFDHVNFYNIQFDTFSSPGGAWAIINNFGTPVFVSAYNSLCDYDYQFTQFGVSPADGRVLQLSGFGAFGYMQNFGTRAALVNGTNEPFYLTGGAGVYLADTVVYGNQANGVYCRGPGSSVYLSHAYIEVRIPEFGQIYLTENSVFAAFYFADGIINTLDGYIVGGTYNGLFLDNGSTIVDNANDVTGLTVKNNVGVAVKLGTRTTVDLTASTTGFKNGGSNSSFGFDVVGPNTVVKLSSSTNISGASGDIRINGFTVSYTAVSSSGPITDPFGSYISRS